MHYRAHPRHYRAEYVRGYQHRQADVYSQRASCCDYFTMIFLPQIRFYGCGLTILVDHFCGLSISFLLILPSLHAVHYVLRQQVYWLAKVQVR